MTLRDLWDKQVGQCWYCGSVCGRNEDRIMTADGDLIWPAEVRPPHVDHKHPRSRGGKGGDNLVLACAPCNGAKSDMTVNEYRAALESGRGEPVEFFGESAF